MEGREKNTDVRNWLPLTCTMSGDQTQNPGMCPDAESNHDLSLCGMTPNQWSHIGQG